MKYKISSSVNNFYIGDLVCLKKDTSKVYEVQGYVRIAGGWGITLTQVVGVFLPDELMKAPPIFL